MFLNKNVGLYIHIPFCRNFCPYCDFYKELHTPEGELQYLNALERETRAYLNDNDLVCDSVYIGGGTPGTLSGKGIETLRQILKLWTVKPGAEQTIELNPESTTLSKLKQYKELGFNRISLGVQSFIDEELSFLGRIHRSNRTREIIKLIDKAGFKNINFDFMFSLPHSGMDSIQKSLDIYLDYKPSHISTYALSIEKGTPFYKMGIQTPSAGTELIWFRRIRNSLIRAGYQHYEVSAFALPGYVGQHNYNYWKFGSYIGLGAGAHSFFKGIRYAHPRSLKKYLTSPEPVFLTLKKKSSKETLIKEYLIFNFRLLEGFSIGEFNKIFDIDFLDRYKRVLKTLKQKKLIKFSGDRISVTVKGLYVLNEVLLEFI